MTGKPGKAIPVDDPYNMYFTPDGKEAIVVAEAFKRLDFRDPQTMALQVVAADAAVRGHQPRRLLDRRPLRDLHLRVRRQAGQDRPGRAQGARLPEARRTASMPQDIRVSPDGSDLLRRRHDGRRRLRHRRRDASRRSASSRPAWARTASTRAATARSSTSPTAARTRSTAPSTARAASRCSTSRPARSTSPGRSPAAAAPTWATSAPTASGSGSRAATTTSSTSSTPTTGAVKIIPVGIEPHGLTVWPQPGRYSLGHTGNMR